MPTTCGLSTSDWTTAITPIPRPPMLRTTMLRSRSRIGFGRLLRGTDQAMLAAFWIACPSPIAP